MTRAAGRLAISWTLIAVAWLAQPHEGGAQQSPHGALPESLDCRSCHGVEAWSPLDPDMSFDHSRDAAYPLTGQHADASCESCHENLIFEAPNAAATDCRACHVDVHQGSSSRPCAACHTTESFTEFPLGIVHPAAFPLDGAHLVTSCESCHISDVGGAFSSLPTECATCHFSEYAQSALVDHEALGFSTDCTECHSTLDFRDVPFDHFTISGGFELTGRHAGLNCASCHSGAGGVVPANPAGPMDCYACHATDYSREHSGSGFPTECLDCHTTAGWDGATFNHTFQIFNGPHSEEWDDCSDCHTVPADFSEFSCFACHSRRDMDDKHSEEQGYAYDSPTCLSCHPTGRT